MLFLMSSGHIASTFETPAYQALTGRPGKPGAESRIRATYGFFAANKARKLSGILALREAFALMYGRCKLKWSAPKSDEGPEEIGSLEIREWLRRFGITARVPDECSQAAKWVIYQP